MRIRPFSRTFAILILFFLFAGIVTAFWRNPLADRWEGDVYVADSTGAKRIKLEGVKLRVDIVGSSLADQHMIRGSGKGIRYVFTGENRKVVERYGFGPEYWSDGDGDANPDFNYGFCQFSSMYEPGFVSGLPLKTSDESIEPLLQFTSWETACKTMDVGMAGFNQIVISAGVNNQLGAVLERDSLMGPLQWMIVRLRYGSWRDEPAW